MPANDKLIIAVERVFAARNASRDEPESNTAMAEYFAALQSVAATRAMSLRDVKYKALALGTCMHRQGDSWELLGDAGLLKTLLNDIRMLEA